MEEYGLFNSDLIEASAADLQSQMRGGLHAKADSLNGVQWKGSISFTASAGRVFPHDTDIPKYSATARKLDVWSEWKAPDLASYFYSIEKRNGVINLTRKPPMQITPVKCNEIRNKLTQKGMACVQSRKVFPPFVREILL
jgi:hypothetical protein